VSDDVLPDAFKARQVHDLAGAGRSVVEIGALTRLAYRTVIDILDHGTPPTLEDLEAEAAAQDGDHGDGGEA
jgi:hypothetical protein